MVENVAPGGPQVVDAGHATGMVGQAVGQPLDPASRVARARFERELAVLDLSDAAQAASRSDSTFDPAPDGHTQAQAAVRLYASADEHRRTAELLDLEAAPPDFTGDE